MGLLLYNCQMLIELCYLYDQLVENFVWETSQSHLSYISGGTITLEMPNNESSSRDPSLQSSDSEFY